MPQQVGEIIAHTACNIVVICLANTAGKNLHESLARTGIGYINGRYGNGLVLSERYNSFNLVHALAIPFGVVEEVLGLSCGFYPLHRTYMTIYSDISRLLDTSFHSRAITRVCTYE